jgi:hypothetical protein
LGAEVWKHVDVTGSIQMDRDSIVKAWRRSGGRAFWISLRTTSDDLDGFVLAVAEASELDAPDLDVSPIGEFPARGPRGFVVQVDDAPTAESLEGWLDRFVAALERRSISGTALRASSVKRPHMIAGMDQPLELTAYVSYEIDLQVPNDSRLSFISWGVEEAATEDVCAHIAAWACDGGPKVLYGLGNFSFWLSGATTAPEMLRRDLEASVRVRLAALDLDAERGRQAKFGRLGTVRLQHLDRDLPWHERVEILRDVMATPPEHLNQAFIRPGGRTSTDWSSDIDTRLRLPRISGSGINYCAHLFDRYVPDAHGVQVLSDAHLERAHDLSTWTITDLGHGRHLVEATDLGPWYADGIPDAAVLEAARRDFGDMILSFQTYAENPPPWGGPVLTRDR